MTFTKFAFIAALLSATALAPIVRAADAWPQASSDLPADSSVRFGVLPNGMKYAVMRNATPAHASSLRLRIGSGSLEESDDEQGLAHVLEHMAFKGSTQVAPGDMIKKLERLGLGFGADTNAQTGWTQTVYEFDLPRSDQESLDTGLMLMREIASDLTLTPEALATERGVVLSEERLRDTPGYRAEKAQLDLFLHGQLAARRFPIGQVDIVEHAPASLIRKFYETNYRPDRATIIAVGDFDPAAMEAEIKARFGDWRNPASPEPHPDLGTVEPRGATVKLVPMPGGSSEVVIAWARPYDASPDTAAKERREVIENLGLAVLNRRLARLARSDAPPFLNAQVGFQNLFHSDKVALIEATAAPGGWRRALSAADVEVRRLIADGVTPAELAREITEMRTQFKAAADGASTRLSPTLAQGLVESVDEDEVFTAPSLDLQLFDQAAKGLGVDEVNEAVRKVFAGSGPLVELVTPESIEGGDATVVKAFADATSAPIVARAAEADIAWPYATFGASGAVTDRKTVADLGLTTVRYANGVTLTVKPTKYRDDQILISVRIGQGRLELPRDVASPTWAAGALIAGGFGKIGFEDAQAALAGKVHSAAFAVDDDAFDLTGATRPVDLGTELQVLSAYVADPGFRPQAFERLRTAYLAQLPQLDATPGGVFARASGALLTSGDKRFAFPSRAQLVGATPDALRRLLSEPLAHDPIEVTIVGDITADQAIAEVAKTFGALPARTAQPAPTRAALTVVFPAPTATPIMLNHTGRADQAVGVIAWPMPDFYADMRRSRVDMLTGEVFENRLLDRVRIAEGATYSPEAEATLSQTFPDYGDLLAQVEMPPAKLPGFFDAATKIASDMATTGVTPDELVRARAPRVSGLAKAQLTNEYWLADLSGSIAEPRKLDLIRSTFPDYNAVTTAEIQAAAKRWLTDDKAWRLEIVAGK
jgi:zinc protease